MNRRGFIGLLAGALALDPERALWMPGQRKIFTPPAAGWSQWGQATNYWTSSNKAVIVRETWARGADGLYEVRTHLIHPHHGQPDEFLGVQKTDSTELPFRWVVRGPYSCTGIVNRES